MTCNHTFLAVLLAGTLLAGNARADSLDTGSEEGAGGLCLSAMASAASAGMTAFGVISSITGRSTAGLQVPPIIQGAQQIICHTEEIRIGDDQLSEQRRMTAGIGRNMVGPSSSISNGVLDTLRLNNGTEIGKRYQD